MAIMLVAAVMLLSSCMHKKYENPISKDTQQPDKVLFDRAIADIERGRYEVARLTLQTLMNTYDTSEFLAKSKLAIADSWFREGGTHGMAQAEAEYKDFILFYPTMEEAAEAQEKVCDIHYKQMEKPDRDRNDAIRAEDECRQLLVQFPNSKFAPGAQQKLRNIQEVIAEGEFRTGSFYHHKGSFPAAANRLQSLSEQYPLYSGADEVLWQLADSYGRMGDRFEDRAASAYTRIVKDYPLSEHVEESKKKLQAMNRPIPAADAAALERMKYELENRTKSSLMSRAFDVLKRAPDVQMAAKSGSPAMTSIRPGIPVSVPQPAGRTGVGTSDVSVQAVTDTTLLDTKPDARQVVPGAAGADGKPADASAAAADKPQPLPGNHTARPSKKKDKAKDNKDKKAADKTPAATPASAATPSETKQ
ncbi:MAG: outer membrane protein assembly factor BamD [Candidatus Solibacter usitatus]|nr:outer membrane protein assembly factor BamD [Candidatus Solibacter usitatus]